PFFSPTSSNGATRQLRPPLTTFATRLIVTTRSSISSLFGSMLVCIYVPPLSIKIQDLPRGQLLPMPLHVHDKGSPRDRIQPTCNLYPGHVLRLILRFVLQLLRYW